MSKDTENKAGFDSPQEVEQAMAEFVKSHIRLRKVISGFIDFALFCMPAVLIMRIVMKIYEKAGNSTETEGFKAIFDSPLVALVLILLFMLKDIGRSPGKRIMKLKLVTADGSRPPFWKRALRSVTVVIFQIEALVLLFSGRRIADWVLGLQVVDAEENAAVPQEPAATDGEERSSELG